MKIDCSSLWYFIFFKLRTKKLHKMSITELFWSIYVLVLLTVSALNTLMDDFRFYGIPSASFLDHSWHYLVIALKLSFYCKKSNLRKIESIVMLTGSMEMFPMTSVRTSWFMLCLQFFSWHVWSLLMSSVSNFSIFLCHFLFLDIKLLNILVVCWYFISLPFLVMW